ncbi:MAG: transketolase [Candidatus Latescibacterota bacterium]|nr:MAG: transketolase [Candidatus Latescibacterota bacterium]
MMLNYRQSGHPGGSRSKVHALLTTLLSGAMRWDIRHPEKRFADRFVLVAGHCTPLLYSVLAVLNEPLRLLHQESGAERYRVPEADERALYWQDLLTFRRNGGLPGHAEMEGKTLFVKANTGPSGHGSPPAAGIAMALKRAGAEGVRVFALEGEGGLTAGAAHETRNSAWGLGLDNLVYCVDWNDYGIDPRPASAVVHGTPADWFGAAGWRTIGVENGMEWPGLTRGLLETVHGDNPERRPNLCYFRTRKGRGYGVFDYKSHGTPHKANSELYWRGREEFAKKYGVEFAGFGEEAPQDQDAWREQVVHNFEQVMRVMREDEALVRYLGDRLVDLGDSVPEQISTFRFDTSKNPMSDPELTDYENYPTKMYAKPGAKAPNRAALAKWGAWVNTWSHQKYNRPLFVVMSADLADSTNISGFAKGFDDFDGYGWFDREANPEGVLLPQEITEFANSGIACGMASTNFSERPYEEWQGFLSGCSTYGSFVYLKYGPMRLFSQLAQDSQIQVGKVLWVAGHSGPETAEDSRTHFGIFSPYVTQLFPDNQVVDLHPWEHNEVPVVIAAGLRHGAPILALHLTRPSVEIPDREALGIASHFAAAKGAYVMRDYDPSRKRGGVVIVSGTSTTANMVKILPDLKREGLNVKVVAAISPQLFRSESKRYQESVLSPGEWLDSMVVSNRGRRTMNDWIPNRISAEYAMTSDWDDRWRTGGSVEEIVDEAHLSPRWLLQGIERFVRDRDTRLKRLRDELESAERG